MKILIIYGTSEGQTRKIARFLEDVLQEENHKVVIADASDDPPPPSDFDAVLVGSSIHMHKYQRQVLDYVSKNVAQLNKKHSGFFSVCLAVASDLPEEHEEAEEIAMNFLYETGWRPSLKKHIAGALKYTQYDYLKRLVMRMIAKKQGESTDTSQDHEYTDWDEVRAFALEFAHVKN